MTENMDFPEAMGIARKGHPFGIITRRCTEWSGYWLSLSCRGVICKHHDKKMAVEPYQPTAGISRKDWAVAR